MGNIDELQPNYFVICADWQIAYKCVDMSA